MLNKNYKIKIFLFFATVFTASLFAFISSAQEAGKHLDLSAYILNNENKEVPNGTYNIRFSIYTVDRESIDIYPSDSDASSRVWEEEQEVEVINGTFNVYLGSINSLPEGLSFEDADYYLGIRVGNDSEAVPRKKISYVPLAMNANYVRGAKIGTEEGDILQLGKNGKIGLSQLPTGNGSSNKELILGDDGRLHDQNTDEGTDVEVFNIGTDTSSTGNNFDLAVSSDTNKPAIRFNGSTQAWQYSNNGTSFNNIATAADHGAVTLSGSYDYITISSQQITLGQVNLSTDVTGTLPMANGGTGSASFTSGSIPFSNGTILTEDNSNFYWDDTNNRIGIGTNTPTEKLTLEGGNFLQNAGDPVTAGNWDPNDTNVMDFPDAVYVSGKYAYVAGLLSSNLAIVDISDPSSPTTVGNWDPNDTNVMEYARSVYVSGKYAYITGVNSDNLAIVDISDPSSPTTVGNWDPNDTNVINGAYSVYVSGSYAYVTGQTSDNLAIVDISDPTNPTTVGNWDPNDTNVMNWAYSVYVSGKYAYVAGASSDNLTIVDISDPTNPTTVGNWDPNDTNVIDGAVSVYISGRYAYIAGQGSDNLTIVDISDPTNPTTVGNWDPNDTGVMDTTSSVYVSGKYAYVGGSISDNLIVLDISDPTNPTTVGNWDPNDTNVIDGAVSVYVSGKYAYVAGYNSDNLTIVDISGIDAPSATIGDLALGTLDVWENVDINNNLYIGSGLNVGTDALINGDLSVGSTLNVDSVNNRVGIGTTNPGATLDVAGHIWQTSIGNSVFIGEGAGANDDLSANQNVFVGYNAGTTNTTGTANTSIGLGASFSNLTGDDNTAIGYYALSSNSSGQQNTAVGTYAGWVTTSGNNSLFGYRSGYALTTGANNVLIGARSGENLISGTKNISLGYDIDFPSATTSNQLNIGNIIYGTNIDGTGTTLSSGDIGVGVVSPGARLHIYDDVTTDYTTEIYNDGNNTDRYGLLVQSGLDDQTAAGPSTLVQFNDGDGGSVGSITFGSSATAYNTSSDRRLKENIIDTSLDINNLMDIKIRDFNWRADKDHKVAHGVIAQELLEVYPDAVTVFENEDRMMMVDYSKLTPLIVKSIQDQQGNITINSGKISDLLLSEDNVDEKFEIIGDELEADAQLIASLEDNIAEVENNIENQNLLMEDVQDQLDKIDIELINTQLEELMDFMLAVEIDNFIKLDELNTGDMLLDGKLEVDEAITEKLTIRVKKEKMSTIGTAEITPVEVDEDDDGNDDETGSDGKSVTIETEAVTEDSKVFVSPKVSLDYSLAVTEIVEGESFRVEIKDPTKEYIEFDWWVVESLKQ